MVSNAKIERGDYRSGRVDGGSAGWLTLSWLALISASSALTFTVLLFDRTTLAGVTRLWLGSLVLCFVLALAWWLQPRIEGPRISINRYEQVSLMVFTVPLAVAGLALVAGSYLSEEIHKHLFDQFYYRQLLSDSSWPISVLPWVLFGYALVWMGRSTLLRIAAGARPMAAFTGALSRLSDLLPAAALTIGVLLSTAAVSTINVNFWRYWATADGWAVLGHYPSTFTDRVQVVEGGGNQYFISYPLLPILLTGSFNLLGHNTLAAHLPMIAGGALMPLAVFLLVREFSGRPLFAFVVSTVVGAFPLLRSYTMDMAEADGLFVTLLLLSAYLRLKADRPGGGLGAEVVAACAGGLTALARPEGVFYVGAMYAASFLERWRERRFWWSVLTLVMTVGLFSGVLLREFGVFWPDNYRFAGSVRLENFWRTLSVVQQARLFEMYASALGMSQEALAAVLSIASIGILLATAGMVRARSALVHMPVAAVGNLAMVLLVGPVPAEAGKFHDFFRHISYGLPFLGVTLAYGIDVACGLVRGWGQQAARTAVLLGMALLAVAELSLLAGPVTPGAPVGSPIMTSDVHIAASTLVADPYPLPTMKFRRSDSRYVPDAEDYMAVFPDDVREHYARADVRLAGNTVEYYDASRLLFLGFLGLCGLSVLPSLRRRAAARSGARA